MNLKNYPYLDLNITEVDNVVEALHDKTDSYLDILQDDEEYQTAEEIKYLMLEYIKTVRSQTNVLSMINKRFEETNRFINGLSKTETSKINREIVKSRYA